MGSPPSLREVLRLLLWKSLTKHRREPMQVGLGFISVALVCVDLLSLRMLHTPEGFTPTQHYTSYTPDYLPPGRIPHLQSIFNTKKKSNGQDPMCLLWEKGEVLGKRAIADTSWLTNLDPDNLDFQHPQIQTFIKSIDFSKIDFMKQLKEVNVDFLLELLGATDIEPEEVARLIAEHGTGLGQFLEKHKATILNVSTAALQDHRHDISTTLKRLLGNPNFRRWIVVWSPVNPLTTEVMEDAMKKTPFIGCGVDNSSVAMHLLQRPQGVAQELLVLAAVAFPDDMDDATMPGNLSISIRFPGPTRYLWDPVEKKPVVDRLSRVRKTWDTMHVFPWLLGIQAKDPHNKAGGTPSYFYEGFLGIQDAISDAIIQHYNRSQNGNIPPVSVRMQRLPDYARYVDTKLHLIFISMCLSLPVAYMGFVVITARSFASEKEVHFTGVLQMLGVPISLNGLAGFIDCLLLLGFGTLLFTIGITLPGRMAILPNSNPVCVYALLFSYSAAIVSFAYFSSAFYETTNHAATGANAIFFFSNAIFIWLEATTPVVSYYRRVFFGFSPNVAMNYAFKTIQTLEGLGEGLQWHNMRANIAGSQDVPTVVSICTLWADCALYWLAAVYVESLIPGPSGIARPWHFPISQFFSKSTNHGVKVAKHKKDEIVEEPEPSELPVGIQMSNLRKVFGKGLVAVNGLTLKVFQGQITVLLGHNGAGKTTTMSMLTGMIAPSGGSVKIGGYDMSTNLKEARRQLGYCPQRNILLDHLTVEEHIYLFARLKGIPMEQLKKEMNKYIFSMNLQDKLNTLSVDLSGGWKRKLSIVLALIGDSPVVILDEPTSGMDAEARRTLWDVLQKEKTSRTVLLTTHYMDEADILGDRIVMIASGKLQCIGSSFYLKNKIGRGYNLVMVKSPECSAQKVLRTLKREISEAELASDVGAELSFKLPREKAHLFPKALLAIDEQKDAMGVSSYGLTSATLDDVLMATMTAGRQRLNSVSFMDDPCEDVETEGLKTGVALLIQQMFAVFCKRWITLFRNRVAFIFWMTYPSMFGALTIVIIRLWQGTRDLPPKPFTFQDYNDAFVGVQSSGNSSIYEALQNLLHGQNVATHTVTSVVDFFLQETFSRPLTTFRQFVFGVTIDEDAITGIYSTSGFHMAPLALQTAYNSILQGYVNKTFNLNFVNHPQPYTPLVKSVLHQQGVNVSHLLGTLSCCTFFNLAAWCIAFYVKERSCRSKLLQQTTGIPSLAYWAASLFADYIFVGLAVSLFAATVFSFQEEGLDTAADAGKIIVLLMTFFIAILTAGGVMSFLAEDGATLQMRFNISMTIVGPFAFCVIGTLTILDAISESTVEWLGSVFRWVPSYAIIEAIANLSRIHWLKNFCQPIFTKYCLKQEGFKHVCCRETTQCPATGCLPWVENHFDMNSPGFGKNIVTMLIFSAVSLLLLVLIETRYLSKITLKRRPKNESHPESEDQDVAEERRLAHSIDPSPTDSRYNLIVRGLCKEYDGRRVVDGVSLAIKPGECFGLLGSNGAGKTTTFKMLTGDIRPSGGDAFIQGCSVTHDKTQIYRRFGYCPQFDGLLDELTGRETLRLYCRLRGVPTSQLEMTCELMARQLLFYQHIDKQVKEFSGGNKRKLSTAVALIGDPAVVFLDEPTSGMDTLAKRYFWEVICRIRDEGKTIILTSHSLEECEALCTRVAVMGSGRLLCIGSPQHLKSRFSREFVLNVKLHTQRQGKKKTNETVQATKGFFAKKLPEGNLAREQIGLLTYHIPTESGITWARMFKVVMEAKENKLVEDFSLDQSSLEDVFLTLASSDTNRSKTD